jgi:hypothetical protein
MRRAITQVVVFMLFLVATAHAQWTPPGATTNDPIFHANDITVSGNVAIDDAPLKAWDAAWGRVIQGKSSAFFVGHGGDIHIISNAYLAPGTWKYMLAGNAADLYIYNGELIYRTAASGPADGSFSAWTYPFQVANNGSVLLGMNWDAPTNYKLDVNGSQHIAGSLTVGDTAIHPADIQGTAVLNPGGSGPAREVLGVYDSSPMASGVGGGIVFGGKFNSTGTIAQSFASIQGVKENGNNSDYAGAMGFFTRANNAQPQEQMRIASNGTVAIGCPYPCPGLASSPNRLEVTGNAAVSGAITAGVIHATYQDVAEWVSTPEAIAAGTVVVVGEDGDNTVAASTHAYDTSVAGVVSANPGLLLGVASASKAKIATTGRVRVRVDATKSPIRKGDLLVTSDRPGMAMKSEPLDLGGVKIHRPGTLIGKALEPLAGGEGEILVLLSLQ